MAEGKEEIEAMVEGEAEGLSRIFAVLTAAIMALESSLTRTTRPNLVESLSHAAATKPPPDALHPTLPGAIARTHRSYAHQEVRMQGEGALVLLTGEANLVD